jgi:hypothetical protein
MLRVTGRAVASSRPLSALVLLAAASVVGCSGGPTAQEQLDAAFKDSSAHKLEVAKLEGQLTIDNQPPGAEYPQLHIVLLEADKYDQPNKAQRWQADVGQDGHFSFTTYLKDDGAPVGKYVVLFLDPSDNAKQEGMARAGRGMRSGGARAGKDRLKNLYNDPEINSKNPEFVIKLDQPGITNQHFNLELAGKEPRVTPGKYAVRDVSTSDSVFKFSTK